MSYGDRSSDVCSSDLSSGKRETLPDGFLFFPTTRRATENVSFLALRNGYLVYFHRSEERRVGKECRSRCALYNEKKKENDENHSRQEIQHKKLYMKRI